MRGAANRLFSRLAANGAFFAEKYGNIRFSQEILLDFTAAGEVYYNRFRMEQRAACRGAILHLFKFVITIGVCNNGIVCQNLSAQEAPARKGAWLPFPYVYQERP